MNEIPSKYLTMNADLDEEKAYSDPYAGVSYSYDDDVNDALMAGSVVAGNTVSHPTYGRGKVEVVEKDFSGCKVTVLFDEFGLRKVSLHHLSVR